jgi:hypothetical protein
VAVFIETADALRAVCASNSSVGGKRRADGYHLSLLQIPWRLADHDQAGFCTRIAIRAVPSIDVIGDRKAPKKHGPTVFEHACRMGLDGIVAKRRGRPYTSGRSIDWIKVKNPERLMRHTGRPFLKSNS